MPSGRTHLALEAGILTASVAVGWAGVCRGLIAPSSLAAFAGGFAFSMLFLSPDLDLARSRPTRRWGALAVFWRPYAWLFRHRGLSHHLVWGPLSRLLYLAALGAAAYAGLAAVVGAPDVPREALPLGAAALAGIYVPNVAHVVADGVGGRRRR